jgi:hypothetical protein
MIRTRAGLLLTPLLAVALAAGPAAAERAQFDFSIAGIRVGKMTFQSERSGANYAAASRIDAAGVLGALVTFFFDGRSTGSVSGNGTVVPATYRADSKSPRGPKRTEIDWKGGVPVKVSVEPPRDSPPDPANQGGTLDPISAGLALLFDRTASDVCNATVDVFDGSRLSRLALGAPETTAGEIACGGTYARLEGEASSMSSAREFPFRLVFHANGDGSAALMRIETSTDFGKAVLERRG